MLSVEDNKALLVSKYGLGSVLYNEKRCAVVWESCTLRTWLNSEFFSKAFTEQEQRRILITRLANEDNILFGTAGGAETEDKIFCLSIKQAQTLFKDDDDRICVPTNYALQKGATRWWWLRSPGSGSELAAGVHIYVSILNDGDYVSIGYVSVPLCT